MPTFTYVARARDGSRQSGTMSAQNRGAAMQTLQSRGLLGAQLQQAAPKGRTFMGRMGLGKKVKSREVLVFTRQLSTIVSAGLPLLQGLDILAEQTDDENFARIIEDIGQNVEAGETFSEALRQHPQAFPDIYVSMVRAGEAGGDLDGVLQQLADYFESMEELRRRIKAAMTYPVVAFSMICLIASALLLFVVPQFEKMFADFGQDLPLPTQLLITASDTLRSWRALLVVAAVVGVEIARRVYTQTETGRYNMDRFKLRLPIFGKLLRKVAISRFTRTLSTLTRSGVAILQALEIVERTAGNEVFARAVRDAGESVRNGETLAEPLARTEEFPAMVTRMIGVGERTGALEAMLAKISDFYDSEVKAAVDGLTSMIEPLLILLMGIVVGFMVIALFMPILKLSDLAKG